MQQQQQQQQQQQHNTNKSKTVYQYLVPARVDTKLEAQVYENLDENLATNLAEKKLSQILARDPYLWSARWAKFLKMFNVFCNRPLLLDKLDTPNSDNQLEFSAIPTEFCEILNGKRWREAREIERKI